MPGGKTHDTITVLLTAPVFAAAYVLSGGFPMSILIAAGFLFGGLMFGPDLDTMSKQYSRWRLLRLLWFPYKAFFRHRSRWTHGLVFGTIFRLIYFMGIVTCAAFVGTYIYVSYAGGRTPGIWDFARVWATMREALENLLGEYGIWSLFGGMWLGAAAHTITDLAGTYIRTGRARVS